jgi:predicted ATP-grasp superfamily ATP-dependent carboligase
MASPPYVFVHEFITGGGWPAGELPHGLANEGAAMLWALLADFRAWGAVHTVTTLDSRLDHLSLPADEVVRVAPGQHEATFSSLLAQSDAVLIVAPETDGILARLSAMADEAGIPLLGSSPAAVAIAADKAVCYRRFCQAGLPTPLTRQADFITAPQVADEIGYPLVVKPLDGVGCEGVCLVTGPAGLIDTLALLRHTTCQETILLQSFVAGTPASVSLLIAEGRALSLSLNGQDIEVGCPFTYRGGIVPLTHPAAARALKVAQVAVGLVPGLQGYVGVDLVLAQEEALLIEINPRLTTSYIGLRQVLQLNLAQAIWDACRRGVLPAKAPLSGQVAFAKDELSHSIPF